MYSLLPTHTHAHTCIDMSSFSGSYEMKESDEEYILKEFHVHWPNDEYSMFEDFMMDLFTTWRQMVSDEQSYKLWMNRISKDKFHDHLFIMSKYDVTKILEEKAEREARELHVYPERHNNIDHEKEVLKVEALMNKMWSHWTEISSERRTFKNWAQLVWDKYFNPLLPTYGNSL